MNRRSFLQVVTGAVAGQAIIATPTDAGTRVIVLDEIQVGDTIEVSRHVYNGQEWRFGRRISRYTVQADGTLKDADPERKYTTKEKS